MRRRTGKATFSSATDDAKAVATDGADAWPRDALPEHLGRAARRERPGRSAAWLRAVPWRSRSDRRRSHPALGIRHHRHGRWRRSTRGRTATHEVGHWLNLRHIWGDDGNGLQRAATSWRTPRTRAGQNYGTPTFPTISCGNGPNGDMFMNYMDYVDDIAMVMFTGRPGHAHAGRAGWANARHDRLGDLLRNAAWALLALHPAVPTAAMLASAAVRAPTAVHTAAAMLAPAAMRAAAAVRAPAAMRAAAAVRAPTAVFATAAAAVFATAAAAVFATAAAAVFATAAAAVFATAAAAVFATAAAAVFTTAAAAVLATAAAAVLATTSAAVFATTSAVLRAPGVLVQPVLDGTGLRVASHVRGYVVTQ